MGRVQLAVARIRAWVVAVAVLSALPAAFPAALPGGMGGGAPASPAAGAAPAPLLPGLAGGPGQVGAPPSPVPAASELSLRAGFVENVGQFGGVGGRFVLVAGDLVAAFAADGVEFRARGADGTGGGTQALRITFEGASAVEPQGQSPLEGQVNYYVGAQSAWRAGVRTFAEVRYAGLYPGVDLVYRSTQDGPKYEFQIAPGARVEAIGVHVAGAAPLTVDATGALVARGASLTLRDSAPTAWSGAGAPVACAIVLRGPSSYGLRCDGWDGASPLTVDPLIAATFLGGSQADEPEAVAVDSIGAIYVAGWSTSPDFPTPTGPVNLTANGGGDAFVVKLSADGKRLLYTTYLGGTGFEAAYGLVLDAQGAAYVTGWTRSADFPKTAGAFAPNTTGAQDAFLVRLNGTGGLLDYASVFGGTGNDSGISVAIDGGGNAFVTGATASSDFPTSGSAFQGAYGGQGDAFVAGFNGTGARLFASYLGGANGFDEGLTILSLPGSKLAVVGSTNATNFPTTASAYDPTANGLLDAFVAVIDAGGLAVENATYLGGAGADEGLGATVDPSGWIYVVGQAGGPDFPTTLGAFEQVSPTSGPTGFVARLDLQVRTVGWSSFLGGAGDFATAAALNPDGDLTVVGTANSLNLPVTQGAFQMQRAGPFVAPLPDAFFTKVRAGGSSLVYSSYLGATGQDSGRGVAVDAAGAAVIVGATNASGFPTSSGAFDQTINGTDAFVAKMLQRRPAVTIDTDPPGLNYTVNGTAHTGRSSFACDEQTQLTLYAPSPQQVSGYQFEFSNWSGDPNQTVHFTCGLDLVQVAAFHTGVAVNLTTEPPGLPLEVDGVSTVSPFVGWWTPGSVHTVNATTPVEQAGVRYSFEAWDDSVFPSRTISVTGPVALRANYLMETFALDIATDPPGLQVLVDGLAFAAPATLWLAVNSTHTLSAAGPQAGPPGVRYAFANWSDGAVGPTSVRMVTPTSRVARFASEFAVTVDAQPAPFPLTVDGVEVQTPWTGWKLNGSALGLGPPAAAPEVNGTRFGALAWTDGGPSVRSVQVGAPAAYHAVFAPIGYWLALHSEPPGVPLELDGSENGSGGTWVEAGTQHAVGAPDQLVVGSSRFTFFRWGDGENRTHTVTVDAPTDLNATFGLEYEVRMSVNLHGAAYALDTVGYGTNVSVWADAGSTHRVSVNAVQPVAAGERLVWESWSDGGVETHLVTVDQPLVLEARFRDEYLVRFQAAGGDPACDIPSCWYEAGATAHLTVKSPWNESAGRREVFRNWVGAGNATNLTVAVDMKASVLLGTKWGVQYYLDVESQFGTANGTGWYDEGQGAGYAVAPGEVVVNGVRYRCTGWSGPGGGEELGGVIFMTKPSNLVAVWQEVSPAPPGPALLYGGVFALVVAAGLAAFLVVRRQRESARLREAWKNTDDWESEPAAQEPAQGEPPEQS